MAKQYTSGLVTGSENYFWKGADNAAAIAQQSANDSAEGFPMTIGSTVISHSTELRTPSGVYLWEPHGIARPVGFSRVRLTSGGTETAIGDRPIDIGGDPFDCFLLIGQSNAVGTSGAGTLNAGTDTSGGAFALNQDGAAVDAAEPLPNVTPNATQIGFGAAFCRHWVANYQGAGRRTLIIPHGYGSTGYSGGNQWRRNERYYLEAINRMREAMRSPNSVAKGIVWCQGEQDAAAAMTQTQYAAYFDDMIAGFRAIWPNIPVVVTTMTDAYVAANPSQRGPVDAAVRAAPNRLTKCALADMAGLGAVDVTHFTAAAYRSGGPIISAAMAAAQ